MMSRAVKWPNVTLFGDSITQFSFSEEGCFGSLIGDRLQRKCDVLNRGFSGYTSRSGLAVARHVFPAEALTDTVVLTIMLGTNDASEKEWNPIQSVPLPEYCDNLKKIVHLLEGNGLDRSRLIMITPPALDEQGWIDTAVQNGQPVPRGKSEALTASYAKACLEVAEELQVDVLNLHDHMLQQANWRKMLIDGVHLSCAGAHFLFNLLWTLIEARTAALPDVFPDWKNLYPEDPNESVNMWLQEHGVEVPQRQDGAAQPSVEVPRVTGEEGEEEDGDNDGSSLMQTMASSVTSFLNPDEDAEKDEEEEEEEEEEEKEDEVNCTIA